MLVVNVLKFSVVDKRLLHRRIISWVRIVVLLFANSFISLGQSIGARATGAATDCIGAEATGGCSKGSRQLRYSIAVIIGLGELFFFYAVFAVGFMSEVQARESVGFSVVAQRDMEEGLGGWWESSTKVDGLISGQEACVHRFLWIQNQFAYELWIQLHGRPNLHRLNQSTFSLLKIPVFSSRTKHFEIRHHFIRDAKRKNLIQGLKILTILSLVLIKCENLEIIHESEENISNRVHLNGTKVKQLPDGIFISQDKYVKDMLTKFDMESVRTATTPYEAAKTKLKDETDPPVNVHLYRSMIDTGCVFLLFAWFLLLVDSFCWRNTFMLLELFLLSIHLFMLLNCFCCAQFDIAGRLVSATSHLVSADGLFVCPMMLGSHDLVATIDDREVVMGMRVIGYPTDGTLTFLKIHLSPQWRFSGAQTHICKCLVLSLAIGINFEFPLPLVLICLSTVGKVCQYELKEGQPIPLTTPMLAIAAAGNDAAGGDDAANEDNAAANEAAGSAAEAHLVPPSPLVSPVREPTPERQPDLDNIISMEDDTTHDGFHVESHVRPDDAPTPTADAAGLGQRPCSTNGLSAIAWNWNTVGGDASAAAEGDVDIQDDLTSMIITYGIYSSRTSVSTPAFEQFQANLSCWCSSLKQAVPEMPGPSVAADTERFPMPDLDIPAEFLAEDAQARKRFEEEQASERLVQRLRAEDLAQEDLPNVSEERAKELDDLMMRMTETDWLTLMMQVGSNPALARELLGADVNEENFIERMNAVKEKKKRALADLRYRALKGKPMKKSEVTQMMRNLVKNQWCAAHNGTITMKDVKAMNKQQLIEEYEYICRRLEKDRLLSAQYNLFRPKPAITEPPSKRQRVERVSSQPASVPAATTLPADDPDSAGGGSSNPAGSATPMAGSAASNTAGGAFGATVTDSTVTTTAAMDSAGSRRKIGVSPFADSAAGPSPFLSSIAGGPSPSNVSTDQIPIAVLFESTSGGINEFFLESDEEEQIGMSRVVADPDSDDEVIAEIIFRGKSISGDGVVFVDKLPDDEIVDPRVKVETVSESASSPPRSRRKHLGVRSDDFLWDKPVEDFFSSESESDDDMENYIPPLPYGAFKDWEIVSCPPGNNYIHVYYQENRRRKYFTYLKELLPHVYREDLLLLRRRMNRYFRLNPEVDVGLELWRDVNMLCHSLHTDDVEDFWRTQDEWIVSSWKLYPKSSVHVLDLTNGKTVYMFVDKFYPIRATLLERMLRHRLTVPPSYCRDVVVAGNIIQTIQDGLRQAYECLASDPIACTARQMVFSSPWLTAKKESGSPLQTALSKRLAGKELSNPRIADDIHQKLCVLIEIVSTVSIEVKSGRAGKGLSKSTYVAAKTGSCCSLISSSVSADYVPAGHVLISADRYRIC
ncbi:hypothetical protein Tco_0908140 [Tanacetum coccineum]|uniref:Uncharacterized protein n=1 Tax=Tanacetum coccineum TaxID=301880 RepID=A0ABQ5CMF3_9ASTR